jgi:CelD/BcsL family acetyltransferase involved in cellulose biosynthesis
VARYRVEWIVDEDRLAAIEEGWDALAASEPTPFGRYAWFHAWWRAFSGAARLSVCALWEGDRLAAVLPLSGNGGRLSAMANDHTPVFRPLAADPEAFEVLVDAVMQADVGEVELAALPAHERLVDDLLDGARRAGRLAVIEPQHVSPLVELSGTYADLRAATKPRWGAPLERFRRKMQRDHDAVFSLVESPTNLDAELERGLEVEASGWKGRAGTAILSSAETANFYRSIARAYDAERVLKLSSISLDGRLVAFDLSLLHGNRLWLLKTGFDESYRRLAPGLVLRLSILERCFDLGLDGHELLGDDSEWKRKFANGERAHRRLRAFRRRPAPALRYGYRRWARPGLRRARRRLRSGEGWALPGRSPGPRAGGG